MLWETVSPTVFTGEMGVGGVGSMDLAVGFFVFVYSTKLFAKEGCSDHNSSLTFSISRRA